MQYATTRLTLISQSFQSKASKGHFWHDFPPSPRASLKSDLANHSMSKIDYTYRVALKFAVVGAKSRSPKGQLRVPHGGFERTLPKPIQRCYHDLNIISRLYGDCTSAYNSIKDHQTLSMSVIPENEVALIDFGDNQAKKNYVPSPSYRHAAPCAPWPWVDIDDNINAEQMKLMDGGGPPIPEHCSHDNCDNCWRGYPQSRYPNWTRSQVEKCLIAEAIKRPPTGTCISHYVDVDDNGHFKTAKSFVADPRMAEDTWKKLLAIERPSWSRTRSIFIENLSGSMLQMLGTKFDIEPFFFSSSLNWIPSRFQADLRPGVGDSITITLTFLRSVSLEEMPDHKAATRPYSGHHSNLSKETISSMDAVNNALESTLFEESIDTKAPLKLRYSDRYLCLDLLSVHVIRHVDGNTIISYHPDMDLPTTGAEKLHDRIRFAGQSVYWQKMFQQSRDPTLLLLVFIWHTMYSWDQALEHLYNHICQLESKVIDTGRWKMNQDLHIIRAHQLYYTSLLDDIRKTVEFIRKHKNPAMTSDRVPKDEKDLSAQFLDRECDNLILEVDRLIKDLRMQESRLKNVMNLVFCSVNISDSKLMRNMTEAAMRDSSAMKQIAYLSMIFLPPSFVAGLFGMNTKEINPGTNGTLPYYVALAAPLTLLTIWIIIAFQSQYLLGGRPFVQRLAWPALLIQRWWKRKTVREAKAKKVMDRTMRDDYEEGMEDLKPNDSWA
ncbi:hypothetical protein NP233_g9075 [Leucocoprinus birnbaumii]|uniref:Uncharacterized protein n=1 Tax=Leucocoprinus birnbaumii TaxID=56174 RepID=A0AAD5VL94_9AGAR|nr:hypothetical protein NP233_g9075 [Leucocoprinus birnbaumii]